jgi:alkylation response protein AidB-like acyl-CoA dehydrogenase
MEHLRGLAARIAAEVLAPNADAIDEAACWPAEGMRALANSGLLALHVPRRLGGHELGTVALAAVTEELGKGCSSTAMCFGMHSVAAKVLATRATARQEEKYLRPIAEGRHICSLGLSEPGTGTFFFLPRVQMRDGGDVFVVDGEKSFVTSGGHADSYVISAVPPGSEIDPGAFTCLAVDAKTPGLDWRAPWDGFGMRGNSSRNLRLNNARVPKENLLGAEGDQIWYVFEVVAPYFVIAMSSVYIGIAQAALDYAIENLKARRYVHTGEALADAPLLWRDVAEAWTEIEATRQLVHHAARQVDDGDAAAPLSLFAAKAKVGEMADAVTEIALRLAGGRGYASRGKISRLHRDARAANLMAPTTHLLQIWLGRSLLGLPLL